MILTKTVKMRWNSRNKNYYEGKGYIFTKLNDEFEVSVKDLNTNSHVYINLQCDVCGKLGSRSYKDYCNRTYEEYLCSDCANRRYGAKNRIKKYLNIHSTSFAQWSIDNYGDDFLEKYWDYEKNVYDPFELTYKSNKEIWIKCVDTDYHPSYNTSCDRFTDKGQRCPYCSGRRIHPKDSLGQYMIDKIGENAIYLLWSDKNNKSSFEYTITSGSKAWWKCINNLHEDFSKKISDMKYAGFRCVKCSREKTDSYLQMMVDDYLVSLFGTDDVTHEQCCSLHPINPQTNTHLRFDNCVESIKLIVEVMGSQHMSITGLTLLAARNNNRTPEEEFQYQQWKDQYKKQYALDHGYHYLEIPYTAEADDKYKELIDNKIKEIMEAPIKMLPKYRTLN